MTTGDTNVAKVASIIWQVKNGLPLFETDSKYLRRIDMNGKAPDDASRRLPKRPLLLMSSSSKMDRKQRNFAFCLSDDE